MSEQIRYGRKRSGISKQLFNKIEDWLETINDEELRGSARKDVIVTGGAIASMLLGEKINDYDVYFRTKETAHRIAAYYVKQFNDANELKSAVTEYTPEVRLENIKNINGVEEERVTIWMKSAGIAQEDQQGEYNYFETLDPDRAAEFVENELNERKDETDKPSYRPVFMSQNAITLSNSIQIIIRFYGEPEQIHSNYDFVHAMCYWDHASKDLCLPAEALEALLSRTLIYKGSLYPIASIFRMKKFVERGWRITAGQQLKIMWQISEIDLTDMQTLREQLTGVDMAYLYEVIEALSNVDPQKINSTYVAAIIDKIFD